MHIRVQTSSNIDAWLRRFEKKVKVLKQNVSEEPRKHAIIGQALGRAIAPKDTGTLINAISWKVLNKDKNNASAMIWVRNVANPKGGRPAGRYAALHHYISEGTSPMPTLPWQVKASTGDFHWMLRVKSELERRYGKAVRDHIYRFREL